VSSMLFILARIRAGSKRQVYSANIHRRYIWKGAKAMVAACLFPEPEKVRRGKLGKKGSATEQSSASLGNVQRGSHNLATPPISSRASSSGTARSPRPAMHCKKVCAAAVHRLG
jgi:hypothetical protein